VLNESAGSLPFEAKSVDAIVLDPPYYDNVMYAELSDYFYVLLRHYLDDIYPEFFTTELTPKADEAVANPAKFEGIAGSKSKQALANDDYERKMTDIFEEMYRVLDDDGIFTLMFTHKRTEAWDTLTTALIEAGFIVTATHPVNTESGYSLHQKDKNAAKSTILLASEKRPQTQTRPTLWSDIRTETRQVARAKAAALDASGDDYTRVDIILASFGDTLEVFTRNYPVVDDTGEPVRPQVALDEAREAVRDYLIAQYLDEGVREVDPVTEWYLMAWLVFEARRFPYDEANRLGKGLGIEVDAMKNQHRLWRKRSSDVVLRSHDERVQTPEDKERSRTVKPVDPAALVFDTDLDKVHAAMYHYDRQGLRETETYITDRGFDTDLAFRATVETLLRVLPSDHPDWELLRDMVVTDIGALIDVTFDAERYVTETDPERQDKLSSYR
jgi:adenine-specific DNA methylase